ncbi:MAG: hypothetical protein ACRYFX_09855 [Janthinobacterium lividum]
MKLATDTPAQTTAFTLDPTLPWLSTDPTMQRPEAFVGMRTVKLNDKGWAPMALYFPGGTTLAMVQITKPEDITEGVYWHEHTPPADVASAFLNNTKGVIYTFGRFEGFGELDRATARRHKQGRVHIELGSDTLDCDLRAHYLREDGTDTCFVNLGTPSGNGSHKLWRVTHYVDMPGEALATLGAAAEAAAGLTTNQQRWLNEEKALRTAERCSEYSARILGGFPEDDCRAILRDAACSDFGELFGNLPTLTPSQAKKCKSGAVAITWRSYDYIGRPIGYTNYYKREDAGLLLDMLRSLSDLQQAEDRVAALRNALSFAADAIQYAGSTDEAQVIALEAVAEPRRELAHAA